jgi:uncharacterized membrane protein YphA (DoxX/SURF4 family)
MRASAAGSNEERAMAETSRNQEIALWVLSGLLTALYLFAGGMKLYGPPEVVANFTRYGHSDAFRLFIGAAEVSGAIGLWIPRLAFWAAVGLILVMFGAVYTHLTNGENAIGPAVIAGLLAYIAWARKGSALFLF